MILRIQICNDYYMSTNCNTAGQTYTTAESGNRVGPNVALRLPQLLQTKRLTVMKYKVWDMLIQGTVASVVSLANRSSFQALISRSDTQLRPRRGYFVVCSSMCSSVWGVKARRTHIDDFSVKAHENTNDE
jgi:hypothetical protein